MTEINVVVTKNKNAMNYTLNGRKIAYKEKNVIVFTPFRAVVSACCGQNRTPIPNYLLDYLF